MTVLDTTDITFAFNNDDYGNYTIREKLKHDHIFRYSNPINVYAKVAGYYKQDENPENYSFSDIYNILNLFKDKYNIRRYDHFYIDTPDARKISHEKLLKCFNVFNQFTCLGLSIALDYSMDELGGSTHKYLSWTAHLNELEELKKASTLEWYRYRVSKYMNKVMGTLKKDKNANRTNLFFLMLGYKCIENFKYGDTPPEALADLVINMNDTIIGAFDNWNMSDVAKSEKVVMSKYSVNKLRKELKAQQEARQRKYNKLLKEFNKLDTEFDCIEFIEEHAEKSGNLYACGYVNPTNAPERTTTVRIFYNPNNDGHEWDCSVRDYKSCDDYNGSDSDMARRYLAGAWYKTFTTETKLSITVDGLSFEKVLKQD